MSLKGTRRSKAEHLIIVQEARVRRNIKERANKDRVKRSGHAVMRFEQEMLMSKPSSNPVRCNTTNDDVMEAVLVSSAQPNKSPVLRGIHVSENTTSNVIDTSSTEQRPVWSGSTQIAPTYDDDKYNIINERV